MRGSNNAIKTHCPQGHPYAGANLYVNPTTGRRFCRTCQRATLIAYRATRRAAYLAQTRAYYRAKYRARGAEGLCRRCGKDAVPDGAWRCATCREAMNWHLLKRFVAGRCRKCAAPRDGNTLHCAACRQVCRVRTRDYVARTGWVKRTTTVSDVRWRYLTGEVR